MSATGDTGALLASEVRTSFEPLKPKWLRVLLRRFHVCLEERATSGSRASGGSRGPSASSVMALLYETTLTDYAVIVTVANQQCQLGPFSITETVKLGRASAKAPTLIGRRLLTRQDMQAIAENSE